MHRGYVKLWRKCGDSKLYRNHNAWIVWTYLLMSATHRPHKLCVGNTMLDLEPGQYVTGRKKLAAELKLSEKMTRNALLFLEKHQMVSINRASKYSIITIINWGTYQQDGPTEGQQQGQQGASRGPAKGQQRATKQECKEQEECKEEEKNGNAPLCVSLPGYSDGEMEVVRRTIAAIAATRKTGKVADSVILAQLKRWSHKDKRHVLAGMRTYLDQGHADNGKNENYLWGIIRRTEEQTKRGGKRHDTSIDHHAGFEGRDYGQNIIPPGLDIDGPEGVPDPRPISGESAAGGRDDQGNGLSCVQS